MTPTELKQARLRLGLNIKQMAEALQTPYRTYQDWEGGRRRIPGITEVAVDGLAPTRSKHGHIRGSLRRG